MPSALASKRLRLLLLGWLLLSPGLWSRTAWAESVIVSTLRVGHAQADGRRYITERHTLDTGEIVTVEYLGNSEGATERMAVRATEIESQRSREATDRTEQTVRERVRRKVDNWLRGQTDAALRSTLSMTQAEVDALRRELEDRR